MSCLAAHFLDGHAQKGYEALLLVTPGVKPSAKGEARKKCLNARGTVGDYRADLLFSGSHRIFFLFPARPATWSNR